MKRIKEILFVRFVIIGPLVALVLAGCGSATSASTAATQTPLPPTDMPTATSTPVPRSALLKAVTGTVEIKHGDQGEYAAAAAGLVMAVGDALRTGKDGRAVIMLDDGTGVVIAAESTFALMALEGTHETPITRLLLSLGAIFTIGQGHLPAGASYDIETPSGVAAIRGSMLWVRYDVDKGMQAGCLIGKCSATSGNKTVDLGGGEKVSSTSEGLSEVGDLDAKVILEWSKALKLAGEAGIKVDNGIDPTCACDGPDMKCADGTTVAAFPTCTEGAACTCSGSDLVCGNQTQANSPVCTASASNCTCAGPNLICDNNQTFLNVPACSGGQVCLCKGADLTCPDGTVYPGDLSCSARTGCTCQQGVEICSDGSMAFNTPSCASDLPCVCNGTTFVCTSEGQTFSIPNYPLCGGGGGTTGGGGPTCVCSGSDLYCSDGSITPGDPSCAGAAAPSP